MRMKAIWNGVVLAESDETVVVEGNHYFPRSSCAGEFLEASSKRSVCPWKGMASYYSLTVNGQTNTDAAWEYKKPSPLARRIKDHGAFWHGVQIVADEAEVEGTVSR